MKQIKETTIKSVCANKSGWQIECWDLAKSNQEFTIGRISDKNLPFIDDLSAAYQYATVRIRSKMIFIPQRLQAEDGSNRCVENGHVVLTPADQAPMRLPAGGMYRDCERL